MTAWHKTVVGVASLDEALTTWVDIFGLDIVARAEGDDPGLNQLWNLEADSIRAQALLATPGQDRGMVHLVEFHNPEPPVRSGANAMDLCPKNLDLYIRDMAGRLESLKAEGLKFKNDRYTKIATPDGNMIHEIHAYGHDETNLVLLDFIGEERPFSDRGFAGIGPLVTTVGDADAEKAFYKDILCLDELHDLFFDGPEIEKMIGLPPGAGLALSVWGKKKEPLGQVEVIQYQGVESENLYPKAKPKATGTLMICYLFDDLAPLCSRLDDANIEYERFERIESQLATTEIIRFNTPTGMSIEAHRVLN